MTDQTPTETEATEPAYRHAVLSNGRYSVVLSSRGAGRSSRGDLVLNHWAGDRVSDFGGYFFHLRDIDQGSTWGATGGPIAPHTASCRQGTPGRVDFEFEHSGIVSQLSCCVDPDRDFELRRLTLTNRSQRRRRLSVTSCLEAVLSPAAAFEAHPAFSKLFLQTEFDEMAQAIVVRRRPRGEGEVFPTLAISLSGPGSLEYDTDRVGLVGRGHTIRDPLFLSDPKPLAQTIGNVLDPCPCLRRAVELTPGETVELVGILGVAEDPASARMALRGYGDAPTVARVFAAAEGLARATMADLELDPRMASRMQSLAVAVALGDPRLRGAENGEGSTLPRDASHPSVFVRPGVDSQVRAEIEKARSYWNTLGFAFHMTPGDASCDDPGRPNVSLSVEGPLESWDSILLAESITTHENATPTGAATARPLDSHERLLFPNGIGGFSEDGREYVLRLQADERGGLRRPPLPWSNILANPEFGAQISETGSMTTWKTNSRLFRLTPWPNDPLGDPHHEAFYLVDRKTGAFWSALPGPCPSEHSYEVRHGYGYSRFRHTHGDLEIEATIHVPWNAPLRVARIRVQNHGTESHRLAVVSYSELVLGDTPRESSRDVVTESREDGTLLARSRHRGAFASETAFASVRTDSPSAEFSATGDRRTFLGPGGDVTAPTALSSKDSLEPEFGANREPCFAQCIEVEIAADASNTFVFLLGSVRDVQTIDSLIQGHGVVGLAETSLEHTAAAWRDEVERIEIRTPSAGLDLMVNGWLHYQTLSCRMWGRTATYQSGGAFGFRDQLQDSSAFLLTHPSRTRDQILSHASHQFVEGDVLHWWHPPHDEGIRTRFADDLLWLPHITLQYVESTGDDAIFDEVRGYMKARALAEGEDEAYLRPEASAESGSVFEHCCRAIDRSLEVGAHGLPLFGTGDWNDGMNRVGRQGRGESVWMAFFLVSILEPFARVCEQRRDENRARRYREHGARLLDAVNAEGWDGAWYRRGFYDDGSPLGSAQNDECRIDALAQAWAVLSGAAPVERARQAMQSMESHLISRKERLIRLLAPPFQDTAHDPGYIKGYLPGVRENGGQYTHAALWVIRAFAELGRRDRVAELLDLINPIHHTRDHRSVQTYQLEPYVVAADVYGAPPHVGRGGWSWYTGSAGWMYRVAVESLLGLSLYRGTELRLRPCLPDDWSEVSVRYRIPDEAGTTLHLIIRNAEGTAAEDARVVVAENGHEFRIALPRDGRNHEFILCTRARKEATS